MVTATAEAEVAHVFTDQILSTVSCQDRVREGETLHIVYTAQHYRHQAIPPTIYELLSAEAAAVRMKRCTGDVHSHFLLSMIQTID